MEFRKASSEAIVMCAWGPDADWLFQESYDRITDLKDSPTG